MSKFYPNEKRKKKKKKNKTKLGENNWSMALEKTMKPTINSFQQEAVEKKFMEGKIYTSLPTTS